MLVIRAALFDYKFALVSCVEDLLQQCLVVPGCIVLHTSQQIKQIVIKMSIPDLLRFRPLQVVLLDDSIHVVMSNAYHSSPRALHALWYWDVLCRAVLM